MEKWQRKHITRNLDELVDLTTFNSSVKAKLVTQKILCKADVEKLDAEQKQNGDMEASRLYYEKLQTRKGAYRVLYEALIETNQSGAYTILIRVPYEVFNKPLTYLGISTTLEGFKDTVIEVHGKTLKLCEFFPDADYEKLQQIFHDCLSELEIYDTFVTNERTFVLASNSVPPKPPYYVPRFLSNRIKVDKSIFKENCPDVFVFKNSIARYQLSQIARPHPTDISSSQLTKITCRFIYLEDNEDWTDLKNSAKVSIHLINYEADQGQFLLEDSSAPSDILMKLGSQNERVYDSEKDFFQYQLSEGIKSSSICICDTPGMGKSFLLANIARLITETCAGRIIVFIQLTTFSNDCLPDSKITNFKPETSLVSVLSYVCPPQQSPQLLLELVKAKQLSLEVFFDGFDELPPDTVKWMKEVFRSIITCENVRIYITSRPHMRRGLEESLGVVAYDMLPFNHQNQVDFLVSYWLNRKPGSDQLSLQSYATSCLEAVNESLTQNDKEIAGIPLLCQLIAEVYGNKKAFRSIKTGSFHDLPVQISGMYGKFIENKIHLVTSNKDEFDNIKLVCIWHALKLLFPKNGYHKTKNFQKIKHLLISSKILKAGILQKHSNGALEFIHRTFAEYLVAEYFATKLQHPEMEKTEESSRSLIAILKVLLKCHNIESWYSGFVYQVIAVFFNSALGEVNISEELKIQGANVISSLSKTEFISVLRACCQDSLLSVFSFLGDALTKCDNYWILECFTDGSSYELLSVCIRASTSQMFYKCIYLVTEVLKLDVAQVNTFKENDTLLQIAAKCANYAAVEYLMDRVSLKTQSLLQKCVSYRNDIQKRENILHLLLNKDLTLIHETPDILLTYGLDVRLFKILVKFGADMSATNGYGNGQNWAMNAAKYMFSSEYLELVEFLLTDFKAQYLFVDHDKWNDALKFIFKRVTLLPATMEPLLNIPGIDIRMQDKWKASLLFSAVEGNVLTNLEQLVKRGVDYNARESWNRSLLHVAARDGGVEVVRYLLSLKLDPNSRDESEWTPLHYAVKRDNLSVVEVLVENGASVQAKDHEGRTALHLSAISTDSKRIEIMKYLIRKRADVNDRDNYGNTPLHLCYNKEARDCLTEMGANIHAKNNDGKTPTKIRLWSNMKSDT